MTHYNTNPVECQDQSEKSLKLLAMVEAYQKKNGKYSSKVIEVQQEDFAESSENSDNYDKIARELKEKIGFERFPVQALYPLDKFIESVVESTDTLQEATVAYLLPMLSYATLWKHHKVVVRPDNTWEEPCVLWTIFSADSGQRKTPILKIINNAFSSVKESCRRFAHREQEAFKFAKAKADKCKSNKKKGDIKNDSEEHIEILEKPKNFSLEAENSTKEGLEPSLGRVPIYQLRDELDSLFSSMGQYDKSKRSDDNEESMYNKLYEDLPHQRIRATNNEVTIREGGTCNIGGGIQPGTLKNVKSVYSSNGFIHRFIIFEPPIDHLSENAEWDSHFSKKDANFLRGFFDYCFGIGTLLHKGDTSILENDNLIRANNIKDYKKLFKYNVIINDDFTEYNSVYMLTNLNDFNVERDPQWFYITKEAYNELSSKKKEYNAEIIDYHDAYRSAINKLQGKVIRISAILKALQNFRLDIWLASQKIIKSKNAPYWLNGYSIKSGKTDRTEEGKQKAQEDYDKWTSTIDIDIIKRANEIGDWILHETKRIYEKYGLIKKSDLALDIEELAEHILDCNRKPLKKEQVDEPRIVDRVVTCKEVYSGNRVRGIKALTHYRKKIPLLNTYLQELVKKDILRTVSLGKTVAYLHKDYFEAD